MERAAGNNRMEIQQYERTSFDGSSSAGAGGNFCERINRKLLEVFSVQFREKFWAEEGQIYGFVLLKSSSGGQSNAVLFRRTAQDPPIVNRAGFVKLNGPMGGVEVNDEVAFHSYLWTLFVPAFNMEYANTLWTADADATDQLICKEVKTRFSPLEVSFAVYNNAVEAHLQVAVVASGVHDRVEVFGRVDSGSSINPSRRARSSLFARSIKKSICVRPDNDGTKLPLSRSVTVVPLGSSLLVYVDIERLNNSPTDEESTDEESIFEELSFDAALTGTETKVASAIWGHVEVTVTWSG